MPDAHHQSALCPAAVPGCVARFIIPRVRAVRLLQIAMIASLAIIPGHAVSANGTTSGGIAAGPWSSAIEQNTPGRSQAYPAGAPKTSSWCNGLSKPENGDPPADFTAVTGLASIFPKFGAVDQIRDGHILIANAKTYIRLRNTREWVLIQDQTENELVGAHFDAIRPATPATPINVEVRSDGGTLVDAPPAGRNDLVWLVRRGSFTAGTVDSVYIQIDMKTTDPSMKVVANVGADWWRAPDAQHNGSNNRGAGNSNWVELSADWSTLYFFSGSIAQFTADPPPPLTEVALPARQVSSRPFTANAPTPCLRVLAPQ